MKPIDQTRAMTAWTRMNPVAAHVSHIRHLARPAALRNFLRKRHGLAQDQAKTIAANAAPLLDQAIAFHDASRTVAHRVRPVLQYYSYLNLATALVRIYQPVGWQKYRGHGVHDTTSEIRNPTLTTPLISLSNGATTLFHSIISDRSLRGNKLSLRDLLVALPMVHAELEHVFELRPRRLRVSGYVKSVGSTAADGYASNFIFDFSDPRLPGIPEKGIRFPTKRIFDALPTLADLYTLTKLDDLIAKFESKRNWTPSDYRLASDFHHREALKILNFGNFSYNEETRSTDNGWAVLPRVRLFPMLTAGLLFSFALSSISRYRAGLLDQIEDSRLNILIDIFVNEADGFMLPAFRNLLFAEELRIYNVRLT